ncbi:hypothetical protein ACFVS2_25025 [Brevibacillus sp. NPDC058079]|uniref:hypothetical protein n=1 Tax=Brevibacillus sp. NPDC058079 TaxID=3346330 RepID=UPI0036ED0866
MKKSMMTMLCIMVSISIIGCSEQRFTKNEEKAFMADYMALVTKPSEPDVLEKKMEGNLERLSKEEASNAVDGMLYAMYQKLPTLNKKADGMQDVISEQVEKKIDINKIEDVKKIEDPTLKAFVNEVLEDHFFFIRDNGRFAVQPNMSYMLEKYEPFMTDSLKAIVSFSKEEYENPFFNDKDQRFDLDKVASRILLLEDYLKKYATTYYNESFVKSKEYYYQIYFGLNNELLVDSKKVLLKETIDHYKKIVEEHPDSQLAKDLTAYLERLKDTNNTMTDDIQVFLTDLSNIQTIDVNNDSHSNTKEQISDIGKDVIQQENK